MLVLTSRNVRVRIQWVSQNTGCGLTPLQVRIAAYSWAESQGIGLPWGSLRDMGGFLFTKLLNLLCFLLSQYYFSGDGFLVSPTITSPQFMWPISLVTTQTVSRVGRLSTARRQVGFTPFGWIYASGFTWKVLVQCSAVNIGVLRYKKVLEMVCFGLQTRVTRNTRSFQIKALLVNWKQCIMQAYFHQCEDDYSTFLFPSENSTRSNLANTTPQSATVTKETRTQFN